MTRIVTKRTALPFLLTVALLLAAFMYWQAAPVAAQDDGVLPAPTVALTTVANCVPSNPRTYLIGYYGPVSGAASYEYRFRWGSNEALTPWHRAPRRPDIPWAIDPYRFAMPGETYRMEVRAIAANGTPGIAGFSLYSYTVGDFPPPRDVEVSYTEGKNGVDYTKARLTWRGNPGSAGWFSVQQRPLGGAWKSTGWIQVPLLDGAGSPRFLDVTGLDPDRGYQFRVVGHSPECEASPWSEIVTLWLAPDEPEFQVSVGKSGSGASMGVWVPEPHPSADFHTFRLDDGDPVKITVPAAQHLFPVEVGTTYSVCVAAGNQRGTSPSSCRSITAEVTSPIASLRMEPSPQAQGSLNAYWEIVPVVNPTWEKDDEGSTHAPPGYTVAIREVGTGEDPWPNADTRFRTVYQVGQSGGAVFNGLKGNTEYEVAVRSTYYGETDFVKATGRTLMYPVRDLTVGFVNDEPKRISVAWDHPSDGAASRYEAVVITTVGSKQVGIHNEDATVLSATFDGLETGTWYTVNLRALGEDGAYSATRSCFFKHGSEGTQNGVSPSTEFANTKSCAAPLAE